MKEKILIVRCQHCNAITAAWFCDAGAEEAIGATVISAANRGAKIEVIESPDGGVALNGCDCSTTSQTQS